MAVKVSICIPAYNNEKHISECIASALAQKYPLKEIVICDDNSSDKTLEIAMNYGLKHGEGKTPIKVCGNLKNLGIGKNLERLMEQSNGRYIIYLCADDLFASTKVVGDVVQIFNKMPDVGVVGRYYYYFLDGHDGAIGVCREKNILIQSCCPSGMAFRRKDLKINWTNKIFIEMPNTVAQYLPHCRWTMLEYDTIAARFHPGGNTGTKKSYYTESPTQNWIDLLGQNYQDFPIFITLKNRATFKLLWSEICLHVRMNSKCLLNGHFLFYSAIALLTPRFLLRNLSVWYRNSFGRKQSKIIDRPLGGI